MALALASFVGRIISLVHGRDLTRTEFVILMGMLPIFYLAVAHVAEHRLDYWKAVVEIFHRARTYDYKALAVRIVRTVVATGRNLVRWTIVAGKAVYRFIVWFIRAVKAADIPTKAERAVDYVIALDIPGKINSGIEFLVEIVREKGTLAINKYGPRAKEFLVKIRAYRLPQINLGRVKT